MYERDDQNQPAIPKLSSTVPGQRRDGTTGAGGGRPLGPQPGAPGRMPRQGQHPDH